LSVKNSKFRHFLFKFCFYCWWQFCLQFLYCSPW